MRWRVSAVRLTWTLTKSLSARSVVELDPGRLRLACSTSSGARPRLWYSTRIPKPRARRATSWPMRPKPTMPSVAPLHVLARAAAAGPTSASGPRARSVALRRSAGPPPSAARTRGRPWSPSARPGCCRPRHRAACRPRRRCCRKPTAKLLTTLSCGPARVEQLVIHAVRQQREQAVDARDPAQQLVAGRRQLVRSQMVHVPPRRSRRPASGMRRVTRTRGRSGGRSRDGAGSEGVRHALERPARCSRASSRSEIRRWLAPTWPNAVPARTLHAGLDAGAAPPAAGPSGRCR